VSDPLIAELEDRLCRYVRIDTEADPNATTSPSSAKQLDLSRLLMEELSAMGAQDVALTPYGAVLATIPPTTAAPAPTIALLAHVDTTPQFTGAGVKPIVHRAHAGQPIVLPDDPAQVLTVEKFPYLGQRIGDDIVTASGTTLLGADDKAGVAIIMAVARRLLVDRSIPHPRLRICFTPDEEIGRGVHADLPRDLGADFAYTLDGAARGQIVHETFSADQAKITITGVSVHPGWAKDKLVNALHLMARVIEGLPKATLTPETTSDRQGFIHLVAAGGDAARATLSLILRDFDTAQLAVQADLLRAICAAAQAAEPRATVTCEITPQYRNMHDWLARDMRPVELALRAARQVGVEPFSEPTRGGTDGSRLTELGVPTPNIFTGMQEIHGPLEWISLQDMAKATDLCVALLQLWAEDARA
jgi:tripeptide aminopeptidase